MCLRRRKLRLKNILVANGIMQLRQGRKWTQLIYSETLNNEYIGRLIKCRLDNFSMSFILYFVNFSICENK